MAPTLTQLDYSSSPLHIAAGLDVDPDDIGQAYGNKAASLARIAAIGLNVPDAVVLPCALTSTLFRKVVDTPALAEPIIGGVVDNLLMPYWSDLFEGKYLASVRSGAPVSMPGMMETVLNVGITTGNIAQWRKRLGARTAHDCLRRYLTMNAATYFGVEGAALAQAVGDTSGDPRDAIKRLHALHVERGYTAPLHDVGVQLRMALHAVWSSYYGRRAIEYRRRHAIGDVGTGVIMQRMVFGNAGETSGSGVAFSRNPQTGKDTPLIEWLPAAQGEDVVDGSHTPLGASAMAQAMPAVYADLLGALAALEDAYGDMVDVEFTVDRGTLYILQARVGKRSAPAAFAIARDMHESGALDFDTAVSRVSTDQLAALELPQVKAKVKPDTRGLGVGGGAVTGVVARSPRKDMSGRILVREMTTADDVEAMASAAAVLTAKGGATCHAAVVARAMGVPCVVGAPGADDLQDGQTITVDGATGRVWYSEQTVTDGTLDPALVEWLTPEREVSEYPPIVSQYTTAAAWEPLYAEQLFVDTSNLATVAKFRAMMVSAGAFPEAVIELFDADADTDPQAVEWLQTIGDPDAMGGGLDAEAAKVRAMADDAFAQVAERYDVGQFVMVVDRTAPEGAARAVYLAELGYRVAADAADVHACLADETTAIYVDPRRHTAAEQRAARRIAALRQNSGDEVSVCERPGEALDAVLSVIAAGGA